MYMLCCTAGNMLAQYKYMLFNTAVHMLAQYSVYIFMYVLRCSYFQGVIETFESQMLQYRQQIEMLESHLSSLHQPSRLTHDGMLHTGGTLHTGTEQQGLVHAACHWCTVTLALNNKGWYTQPATGVLSPWH